MMMKKMTLTKKTIDNEERMTIAVNHSNSWILSQIVN